MSSTFTIHHQWNYSFIQKGYVCLLFFCHFVLEKIQLESWLFWAQQSVNWFGFFNLSKKIEGKPTNENNNVKKFCENLFVTKHCLFHCLFHCSFDIECREKETILNKICLKMCVARNRFFSFGLLVLYVCISPKRRCAVTFVCICVFHHTYWLCAEHWHCGAAKLKGKFSVLIWSRVCLFR